jgi:uncharacterized protein (TIGR03067 family)
MNANKDMMPSTECDLQRIRDFLKSDHYHIEDHELITHLDSCSACRQYLEEQAGEPERWQQATQLLQTCEYDQASRVEFSAATQSDADSKQPLVVKDVIEMLVPSEYPNHLGRLGAYEVTGVVGVGGMGVVLKAIDSSLDRVVAVKVMNPRLAHHENARKRFAREAKAAAAVLHPNVIPIHSVSSGSTLPYLVMSYIRGGSLQKRIDQEGSLPLIEVLRIGSQIAAGLSAAHEQGLIHRDIKPENILLEEGVERVTITDFGLARSVDDNTITQMGSIAGTPQYMSPEQARGEQLDQQSDLFSLGSLLYTLCTGKPPFRDDTSYGVMRKIIDEVPTAIHHVSPGTPSWMVKIVDQLMAKKKENRFASAKAVHELLENCLSHAQQPSACPLPTSLQSQPITITTRGRKNAILSVLSVLAVGIVFLAAIAVRQYTLPYSASQYSMSSILIGEEGESLAPEQASEVSGRVTFGDRERILGTWEVVKTPTRWAGQEKSNRIGEWHTFATSSYALQRSGIAPSKGEWRLDDSVSPRRIAFDFDGAEQKAIYKIEGDVLSLYYVNGKRDYPKSFPSAWNVFDKGVLLILRHNEYADVEFDFDALTPGEANLIAKHSARISLTRLSEITPELASVFSTGPGNLSLPAVTDLSQETARSLATKRSGWLVLPGLKRITSEAATELAMATCALDLGIEELSLGVARALGSHTAALSLNRIRTITPEAAAALLSGKRWLQLSGLESLSVEVASALSQHQGWLSLNGLNAISPESADALASFHGVSLDLNGLQNLDVAIAELLAKVRTSNQFSLNGLRTLSPEVAAALVSGGHRHLSLQGIEALTDESLTILRRHQRRLTEGNTGEMLLPAKFRLPNNQ